MKKQEIINKGKKDDCGSESETTTLETESCSSFGCSSIYFPSEEKIGIEFKIHEQLKRYLTQAQVNRISFFSMILRINKEVENLARNDHQGSSAGGLSSAVIDSEEWLRCAIKEEEPFIISHSEKATQLWKPTNSWWDARSKKNPQLELSYHNRRWSYLWPIINYHKFIARYLKKVKSFHDCNESFANLLQSDLNAVSRHLVKTSLLTASQWMRKLDFFFGWIDTNDEECLRHAVAELHVKSSRDVNEDGEEHQHQQNNDKISLRDSNLEECVSKVISKVNEAQKKFHQVHKKLKPNNQTAKKFMQSSNNSSTIEQNKNKSKSSLRQAARGRNSRQGDLHSSVPCSACPSSFASLDSVPTCVATIVHGPLPDVYIAPIMPIVETISPIIPIVETYQWRQKNLKTHVYTR